MAPTPSVPSYSRFQKLRGYLAPHRGKVIVGVVTLLLVNGLGTYLPLLISKVIDNLQATFELAPLLIQVVDTAHGVAGCTIWGRASG
jgi:ABC-type multidrug transport system fused ATPase/permease subunit